MIASTAIPEPPLASPLSRCVSPPRGIVADTTAPNRLAALGAHRPFTVGQIAPIINVISIYNRHRKPKISSFLYFANRRQFLDGEEDNDFWMTDGILLGCMQSPCFDKMLKSVVHAESGTANNWGEIEREHLLHL